MDEITDMDRQIDRHQRDENVFFKNQFSSKVNIKMTHIIY